MYTKRPNASLIRTSFPGSLLAMESDLAQRDVIGVQDAVLLEDIHSESIFIDNLEKRFKENLIYVSFFFVIKFIARALELICR